MTDFDLVAIQHMIATATDIEVLRGIVMVKLLGGVAQRNATLERLDQRAVSAYANAEADSARGKAERIASVDAMRGHAQDISRRIERLDKQIAQAQLAP